jgi:protein-S-isoprenylcysteine O-methyltransferase Ste14
MVNRQQAYALALVAVQFILLGALALSFLFLPPGQVLWARLLGLVAALAGIGVAVLSILTHMRVNQALVNISPEPNPQLQLVESGLYHYIRHPIYLGVIMTAGGAAVAHGHPVGLVITLLLALFFTYKARFEERWLARVYPAYSAYMARTGRFLPPLRRQSASK